MKDIIKIFMENMDKIDLENAGLTCMKPGMVEVEHKDSPFGNKQIIFRCDLNWYWEESYYKYWQLSYWENCLWQYNEVTWGYKKTEEEPKLLD